MEEQENKIILCMLLCNEEKIVERCFNSIKHFIDAIIICDTGSQDQTKLVVENYCKKYLIELKYFEHKFIDFGYNRSICFREAQHYILEKAGLLKKVIMASDYNLFYDITTSTENDLKRDMLTILNHIFEYSTDWDLNRSYGFFLDADMQYISPSETIPTWKNKLNKKMYFIKEEHRASSIESYIIHLISFAETWTCKGVTYEEWKCDSLTSSTKRDMYKLEEFSILCENDGESRKNECERDIHLLLNSGLSQDEDPKNQYYWYGLGERHYQNGQKEKSVEWYKKCANLTNTNHPHFIEYEKENFTERKWLARYKLGRIYWELDKKGESLIELWEAYNERPTRIEPLVFLISEYRNQGKNAIAYLLSKQIEKFSYPSFDFFNIEKNVYTYQILFEISILAYYNTSLKEGLNACEKLRFHSSSNWHIKNQAILNSRFYLSPLKTKQVINLSFVFDSINRNKKLSQLLEKKNPTGGYDHLNKNQNSYIFVLNNSEDNDQFKSNNSEKKYHFIPQGNVNSIDSSLFPFYNLHSNLNFNHSNIFLNLNRNSEGLDLTQWKPLNPSILCLSLKELKTIKNMPFYKMIQVSKENFANEHKMQMSSRNNSSKREGKFEEENHYFYIINIRLVNYELEKEQDSFKKFEKFIQSRNFICLLDSKDLFNYGTIELLDNRTKPFPPATEIFGMEDCKLFIFQNELWCSFTSPDNNPNQMNPQVAIAKIESITLQDNQKMQKILSNNDNLFEEEKKENQSFVDEEDQNHLNYLFIAKHAIYLEKPNPNRVEKNWLPFVDDENRLRFIYRLYPFQMKEIDLVTGNLLRNIDISLLSDPEKVFLYEEMRGSAGPLKIHKFLLKQKREEKKEEKLDYGWLVVSHEVCHQWEPKKRSRIYQHRFLWYSKDFQLEKISYPFYFFDWSIEYCNGISLDLTNQNQNEISLLLSIGKFDAEAYLIKLDLYYVFSLLFEFNSKSLTNQWESFYLP